MRPAYVKFIIPGYVGAPIFARVRQGHYSDATRPYVRSELEQSGNPCLLRDPRTPEYNNFIYCPLLQIGTGSLSLYAPMCYFGEVAGGFLFGFCRPPGGEGTLYNYSSYTPTTVTAERWWESQTVEYPDGTNNGFLGDIGAIPTTSEIFFSSPNYPLVVRTYSDVSGITVAPATPAEQTYYKLPSPDYDDPPKIAQTDAIASYFGGGGAAKTIDYIERISGGKPTPANVKTPETPPVHNPLPVHKPTPAMLIAALILISGSI